MRTRLSKESYRVGEGERGAPGAAEHLPALDAEFGTDLLEVPNAVVGRVVLQVREGDAVAAAALVHENDAVHGGVEVAGHVCNKMG